MFVVSPEEYQGPILGGVWEMTMAVDGLEEAPADFDEHCGKVAEKLMDESGPPGLVRLVTELAALQSKITCVHTWKMETLVRVLSALSKRLLAED